jgi:hypothetical protein
LILREVEDPDLIARTKRGKVEAYNLLVSRWEKRVFNYLLRLAPIAQHRRGSGYRVSESLPELIPFNQQVHQVFSDAPPGPP